MSNVVEGPDKVNEEKKGGQGIEKEKGAYAYEVIGVNGNIGTGKTTLVREIEARNKRVHVLHEKASNPLLSAFYENPRERAFPFQLFMFSTRVFQLEAARAFLRERAAKGEDSFCVLDRDLFGDAAFYFSLYHRNEITAVDFKILCEFTKEQMAHGGFVDRVVYVHNETETCFRRIQKRIREDPLRSIEDAGVSLEYLEQLEETHLTLLLAWAGKKPGNSLSLLNFGAPVPVTFFNHSEHKTLECALRAKPIDVTFKRYPNVAASLEPFEARSLYHYVDCFGSMRMDWDGRMSEGFFSCVIGLLYAGERIVFHYAVEGGEDAAVFGDVLKNQIKKSSQ